MPHRHHHQGEDLSSTQGIDLDLLKKVRPVTPRNLPFLLFKYPQILPPKLANRILEKVQDFAIHVTADLFAGIAANAIMLKVFPSMRTLPLPKKLPLMAALFALPFVGTFPLIEDNIHDYQKL